jgi:hypothetical protein
MCCWFSHQNRQLIPLRLALLWQPLRQLRFDAFRPNHDAVHLGHGAIPHQSELGIVASHPASTGHNKKLMDGEGGNFACSYFNHETGVW